MKTLAQEYLESHSLTDIYKNHGIRASAYDHLISLNYYQTKAKVSDPMACQCRGMVLRHNHSIPIDYDSIVGDTELYAYPFDRFFNYYDNPLTQCPLDWKTVSIQEKLDGTLCIVYYDWMRNCWNVGTRNTPFAQFPSNPYEKRQSIRDLFDKAILRHTGKTVDEVMDSMDIQRNHTWMFEITSPVNMIVVQYEDISVSCLGCRNNITGMETSPFSIATKHNLPIPDMYTLNSLQDVITFVQKRPVDKHEGVVLCDTNFHRAKVKSSAYIARNFVQGKLASTPRHLTETIIEEGWDDVAPSLPDYLQTLGSYMNQAFSDIIDRHISAYSSILKEVDSLGLDLGTKDHRKAVALAAKKNKYVDMSPIMQSYGRDINVLIDWFHCRDTSGIEKRAARIKKLTTMIQQEMNRNGTSKKYFWEKE